MTISGMTPADEVQCIIGIFICGVMVLMCHNVNKVEDAEIVLGKIAKRSWYTPYIQFVFTLAMGALLGWFTFPHIFR